MNAKRGASLLVALTAVMVGQLFVSLTAAQSASKCNRAASRIAGRSRPQIRREERRGAI
jgi:hypothetical protein